MLEFFFQASHFRCIILSDRIISCSLFADHVPFCIEYQILYSSTCFIFCLMLNKCKLNDIVKSFNLFKIRANIKWTHTISTDSRFTHLYLFYLFQGTEIFNFSHYRNIHFNMARIKNISIYYIYMYHQISFILHCI
jgi:hypothetical protein